MRVDGKIYCAGGELGGLAGQLCEPNWLKLGRIRRVRTVPEDLRLVSVP